MSKQTQAVLLTKALSSQEWPSRDWNSLWSGLLLLASSGPGPLDSGVTLPLSL